MPPPDEMSPRPPAPLLQKPFTPTELARKVRETLDAAEGRPAS